MRTAFSVVILFLSAFYTYMAFGDLNFLSPTGRLAPGFFPRIIGVALVASCLYDIYLSFKSKESEQPLSPYWGITLLLTFITGLFVASLDVLGGLIAMIAFMLVSLSILNRGHVVQNVLISVVMPIAVFAVFHIWLHAAMPEGLIPLPDLPL